VIVAEVVKPRFTAAPPLLIFESLNLFMISIISFSFALYGALFSSNTFFISATLSSPSPSISQ
jgi:hypothetical protein